MAGTHAGPIASRAFLSPLHHSARETPLGTASASDQHNPAYFHPAAVYAGKTQRRTSLSRCAHRRLQTGLISVHRNSPSPGRTKPSLRPAPPH
ncbi:hypothetical protein T08_4079 [Trichinella sp. T8]|nr:hypothetical protein T08_4079 [Trichinella sp. T8]